jgi:NitT/TauT family transport system substrate-binding protein
LSVAYAKSGFVQKNPKLVAAYYGALDAAIVSIKVNPAGAIDDYVAETHDKTDRALLTRIIKGNNYEFNPAPKKSMSIATFMARAGMIKTMPRNWKDYFFATADKLNGS